MSIPSAANCRRSASAFARRRPSARESWRGSPSEGSLPYGTAPRRHLAAHAAALLAGVPAALRALLALLPGLALLSLLALLALLALLPLLTLLPC